MIETLIKSIVKRYVKVINFEAEVKSVDQDKDTCTVLPVEGAELEDVRLKSIMNTGDTKIVVYPKVGSFVMCSMIQNIDTELFVSKVDEIDKVVLKCEDVVINDGELGGMVKVIELTAKLNALENKVNALITWGGSVSPPFAPPTLLQVTQRVDIENTKVKH